MCLGVRVNREKIGNLMVLLASEMPPLYHTKLIKLLYLIDEKAVKEHGVPVTWLDYKVWQYGPVAPEIYFIRDNGSVFSEFIHAEKEGAKTVITPIASFNDDRFSEYELELIHRIISEYKTATSEQLVQITHEKDSLWDQTKTENNIDFSSPVANISNCSIDLSRLIEKDEIKKDNYEGAKEMMYFRLPVNDFYL
ncbi:putative phage-associated protein [Bacteroidales bacterium Barb6XT]|nr:putative phage-associated protein [Bacteroidales bacterium Barb6XT]